MQATLLYTQTARPLKNRHAWAPAEEAKADGVLRRIKKIPLQADTVVDFRTERFEDAARDVDAVLDLVGGETQTRSFQVLRRGGKLVSAVSNPDQELARSHGVDAIFFLVKVTSEHLEEIADLIDRGDLKTRIGIALPLADAQEAHFMLKAGAPRRKERSFSPWKLSENSHV